MKVTKVMKMMKILMSLSNKFTSFQKTIKNFCSIKYKRCQDYDKKS